MEIFYLTRPFTANNVNFFYSIGREFVVYNLVSKEKTLKRTDHPKTSN